MVQRSVHIVSTSDIILKHVLWLFKMDVNILGVLDIINDAEMGNIKKLSLWYYSIYDVL